MVDPKPFRCDIDDCNKKFKRASDLKRHKSDVHNIGVRWYPCDIDDCKEKFKRASNLKQHKSYVHDIGDKVCEYCIGNRYKLIPYTDKNNIKSQICRKCFRKVTGYTSRAEEQMVNAFEKSEFKPYIALKDKIVAHDSCNTRRRPDLLVSSIKLHIIDECDENQHKYYNPECEWGRMDEIIDEFKTGKIVFVRWNPDNYKPPQGIPKRTRKERLKMLLELNREILDHPPPDPISVYYMFYDKNNTVLAQRWKTFFIY